MCFGCGGLIGEQAFEQRLAEGVNEVCERKATRIEAAVAGLCVYERCGERSRCERLYFREEVIFIDYVFLIYLHDGEIHRYI